MVLWVSPGPHHPGYGQGCLEHEPGEAVGLQGQEGLVQESTGVYNWELKLFPTIFIFEWNCKSKGSVKTLAKSVLAQAFPLSSWFRATTEN